MIQTPNKKYNPYNLQDVMEKHNLSYEQAQQKIDELKKKLCKKKPSTKGKRSSPYNVDDVMKKHNLSREAAQQKIDEHKEKTSSRYNVEYQMKKHNITRQEVEEKIKLLKSKTGSAYNVEYQMEKLNLSKEDAENLVNNRKRNTAKIMKECITIEKMGELNFKAMSPKNKEHWIKKGYDEKTAIDLAKDQIKHMQSFTYKDLKINPEKYKYSFNTKIEYWLAKGFSKQEAKLKLKQRQTTFTLKKCIEKHGEIEGKKVWQQRQEKWQNTLKSKPQEEIDRINKLKRVNLESFIRKYGDEIGSIKYEQYRNNLCKTYSKIATRLFNEVIEKFQLPTNEVLLNQNEFYITCNTRERNFFYDFKFNNKIIEFHGDFWHMNPNIYKADDINAITKITAQEKWDFDKLKNQIAKENGYEVLVIWESEYRKDPTSVLNKINTFLNLGN